MEVLFKCMLSKIKKVEIELKAFLSNSIVIQSHFNKTIGCRYEHDIVWHGLYVNH